MTGQSDNSQTLVRSAQEDTPKHREFRLGKLRRITSAQEPLVIPSAKRKLSPVRRKLRKIHYPLKSGRISSQSSPNHRQMMSNYLSVEEKPPPSPPQDSSSQGFKLTVNVGNSCDEEMFDLGPSELLYSSPYEITSSVFSSQCTSAPSCSSVESSLSSTPSTLLSSNETPASTTTIKNCAMPAPETKETCLVEVKPSSAFRKCVADDFENVEDIMKLSPREQALLPRSIYLAAQLAATPNINYSEKYGFRPLTSSKWASPRFIASNQWKKAFPVTYDIPSYLKEASHPLEDLRLLAKPWWSTKSLIKDSLSLAGESSLIPKKELLANCTGSVYDVITDYLSKINVEPEVNARDLYKDFIYDEVENDRAVKTPDKNEIYSGLLRQIDEKGNENRTLSEICLSINCENSVSRVIHQEIQTYITFPDYMENRVEFWNEHSEDNPKKIQSAPCDRQITRPLLYPATAASCGLNFSQTDYTYLSKFQNGSLRANSAPYFIQNNIPFNGQVTSNVYPSNQMMGNGNPYYNSDQMTQNTQNYLAWLQNFQNYAQNKAKQIAELLMPQPAFNNINGTGDTAKMNYEQMGFPNYFLQASQGDSVPQADGNTCNTTPQSKENAIHMNMSGFQHCSF